MKKLTSLSLGLLFGGFLLSSANAEVEAKTATALTEPYLKIQQGLSADDLAAAQAAALAFVDIIPGKLPEASAASASEPMRTAAKQIQDATTLDNARPAFLKLSNQMITLSKALGVSSDHELFIANCPMAFNNQGGQWIQKGEAIANPYFGASMFRCGEIVEAITEVAADDHAAHH